VPRRVLNVSYALGACARAAASLACAAALLCALAAPAQAAPGDISTFAGTGTAAFGGDGGPATAAALNQPTAVAWLADGSALVADYANSRIRRVWPDGHITTVAGTGTAGYSGDGGPATNARLNLPTDVEPAADGGFLIADYGNRRVRRVSPAGVITTVAGTGVAGTSGDGGPATSAQLAAPTGVAVTGDGAFLVADAGAHRVRRVSPGGTITRVAGLGDPGGTGDGGPAVSARLNAPVGVAALAEGGFLVTEYAGHRVRRVSAAGVITRVAGTGSAGFSGDGGAATAARLNQPVGVSTTSDGGFLIGDSLNGRVRKVSADGTISTVAGTGETGYAGDGGPALLARLSSPYAAAENTSGAILVADGQNNRLRLVEGRPPAAGEPPPAAVPPLAAVPLLQAPAGVVQATARAVRLPLVCPVAAAEACRGTIRLVVRRKARRATAARAVVIARGRFSVAAGNSKIVKLPLTRAGRRLLRKRRVVKVTAVVARRGGPNIGDSSERSTVRVKRKRRRGRAAGSHG
jgi:glucose/arabinose dehydrogenase